MVSNASRTVAQKATELYASRHQADFEQKHRGKYVCLEPESGCYFLGDTLDQAVNAAVDAYPGRLTHTLRIGHATALHLGELSQ